MKKTRIYRIKSRPSLGDTNNHVCFEQCSQSRCELNPECIQRVKYINEITTNTSFTTTSSTSKSPHKCSRFMHKSSPILGEIADTELPDAGIRSTYQSPLFKGIKKAIFGALFIHFAVFGFLFVTLSLFNEELSALLGGYSSSQASSETKSVEVLMINMQNLQIEGKQTLLIEKTVNKNNEESAKNLADTSVEHSTEERSIENTPSEHTQVKVDNVQNIASIQTATTENQHAKTEIKPTAEPVKPPVKSNDLVNTVQKPKSETNQTQPIKQTESIKQADKQVTNTIKVTKENTSSTPMPPKETKNTETKIIETNKTEIKQVKKTQPIQESTKIKKTGDKQEIKREQLVQTRSQQQQKAVANSKTESTVNNLKDTAKPSNNQSATVLHPTLGAQTQSHSTANANALNTNNIAKPIKRVQPIYPNRARALNQEGVVEVMFDVNNSGKLENIRIVSATPKNIFEEEVRRALRKWQYERKATKDMRITINFRLNGIELQ